MRHGPARDWHPGHANWSTASSFTISSSSHRFCCVCCGLVRCVFVRRLSCCFFGLVWFLSFGWFRFGVGRPSTKIALFFFIRVWTLKTIALTIVLQHVLFLLGGGNSHIFGIFTYRSLGEDFHPFWLLHIFQLGWNHQLEMYLKNLKKKSPPTLF